MSNSFFKDFLMVSSPQVVLTLFVLFLTFLLMLYLKKKKVSFSVRTLLGIVLGVILGFSLQSIAKFPENPTEIVWINEVIKWFSLFGNGFIDLIRMVVIPVIMLSIIFVIINIKNSLNIKKLTTRTIFAFIVNVFIAALIGIILASLFKLGLETTNIVNNREIKEVIPFVDVIRNLIPTNPIKSMIDMNIIAIIIFSMFIGIATKKMYPIYKEKVQNFINIIDALHKIIISVTMSIINLMPYAVITLIANTIIQRGVNAINDVLKFVGVLYLGLIIMFLVHLFALWIFGLNPITYIKKALNPLLLAFTSRSSIGTLPVAVETLTTSMGVSDSTSAFVMGLGSTAGQAGCSGVFAGMIAINIANISGTSLDFNFILMCLIVIILTSFGIAGVPGGAYTISSAVLSGIGLSDFFVYTSPILSIDPILDMGRTCLNINGSMTISLIVDKSINQLNISTYNNIQSKKQAID